MQVDEKALLAAFRVNHHSDAEPSSVELARLRAVITAYLAALGEQKPVAATYVAGISPEARAALNAIDDNIRQAAVAASTIFVGGENPGLAGAKPVGCATEGCDSPADTHFVRGGVGSYYCASCYLKVQAIPHHPAAAPRAALKAAGGRR